MPTNPIKFCRVCNRPIIRMVRVRTWDGYYLEWSKATYCSDKCRMRQYRRRKKKQQRSQLFGGL